MIKVCHLTSAHSEEDDRIFYRECQSLAANGYETYLVERGKTYDKYGVHLIGVGDIPVGRFKRMIIGTKKIYDAAKIIDADLYHIHDPELLPYALKLKKKGKIVIFDSHENYNSQMMYKAYLPMCIRKVLSVVYSKFETRVAKQIDAFIYPCSFNGEVLHENECKNVVLIDNLVRKKDYLDCNGEYKPGRAACLIGTLSPERCVTEIIEASILSDVPLLLVGDFASKEYQKQCEKLIEGKEHIEWVGRVPHEKALDYMKYVSIGLCPEKNVAQYNTNDNLATKSYEYMINGLPVIVSDYDFVRKVMKEYEYGITVNPDDSSSIAEAMSELYTNVDKAYRLGQNGRKAVIDRYNWETEEKKLMELYEHLLENSRLYEN